MERFINDRRRWEPGRTYWHLYLLPDLAVDHGLGDLVDGCLKAIASYPAISAVPREWLHVTVQSIRHRPAAELGQAESDALIEGIGRSLRYVQAFTTTAGSALAFGGAAILDMSGGPEFEHLSTQIRAAIAAVSGADAIAHRSQPPHMAVGYARDHQDNEAVQGALYQVRPSHAAFTAARVHLVEVIQDAERHQYRWLPVQWWSLE